MPTARRHVTVTAPPHRWKLLGELLTDRRKDLGYTYRAPRFDKASGINQRMAADIEKAAKTRIDHFTDATLRKVARGYQVTYASMLAVLRGDADQLEPAAPAALLHLPAPGPADPPGWAPGRIADDRPWFNEINERRVELAARGIAYPSGADMFGEGTEDAQVWDGPGARLPVGDRVWLIADMRRRAAARVPNSGTGATGA